MKPEDLQSGDVIPTSLLGPVVVAGTPINDVDREHPDPAVDRVYVDVVVESPTAEFDPDNLPAATGAAGFWFLGLRPLRYRLTFLPGTEVEAVRV